MIKFFRKIRQKLLKENKFSKYLLYAIGEILLVVIGILIALQINNWNENKKSDRVLKNYYSQILQELNKDSTYIHQRIKILDSNTLKYNNYIDSFQKQGSLEELLTIQGKLNFGVSALNFNTNTIETLQSTGDIKLIPIEIRNKLLDLKNSQEDIIEAISVNNNVYANHITSAINLGFEANIFNSSKNKSSNLFTELKVADNFPEIALILNGISALEAINQDNLTKSLKPMLRDIDNLSKLINDELKK